MAAGQGSEVGVGCVSMASLTSTVELRQLSLPTVRAAVRPATLLLATIWAAVFCVSLSRNVLDPIGYDQAFWQYVTERVLAGERMYVDVWDQNAPGVLGIHALSTWLVGRSPMALRVFDAGWQLLTMGLLVLLAGRDGGRWGVGWLAASLYVLAYYSGGYVHTAQRDGFAVLPMLIALHVVTTPLRSCGGGARIAAHAVAGGMGLAMCAVKPPLGLVFGVLWWWTLAEAWMRRGEGRRAWYPWLGLNTGFLLVAAAGAALMIAWGWWDGFVRAMNRADVPGYIQGPMLVRQLMQAVLPIAALLAVAVAWWLRDEFRAGGGAAPSTVGSRSRSVAGTFLVAWIKAVAVAAGVLSIWLWPAWQSLLPMVGGLLLPAGGAVLLQAWAGRSRTWRLVALTAGAVFAAIVVQGQFYFYHFPPLLACLAYLAADELLRQSRDRGRAATVRERWPRRAASVREWFRGFVRSRKRWQSRDCEGAVAAQSRGREGAVPRFRAKPQAMAAQSRDPLLAPTASPASSPRTLGTFHPWCLVCLASVALLAGHAWGGKMTSVSTQPWILRSMTLAEHYDQVTRHKPRYPLYSTTQRAARRVRELTLPTDAIACLINEPRLYYLAERPAAHRLVIPNEAFRPLFDEFLPTLHTKRPPVILARVPEMVRGCEDPTTVHAAVFDEAESFFGPQARLLRDAYRVTELIDDICILQPRGGE